MGKDSPFGKKSRVRILNRHYRESGGYTAEDAWKFVYEELLRIDGSIGLAHLYESDKAQEGRSAWYKRSVVFTDDLCREFGGIDRAGLKARIDRLFLACLALLLESRRKPGEEIDPDEEELVKAVAEAGGESGLSRELV
jgi:hypothetical protein